VLFIDHVGALGGAELAIENVIRAYRETSTVVLFADGPFRERLREAGVVVEVLPGGSALHAVRRETKLAKPGAMARVVKLAFQLVRIARQHDVIHANSQKAFVVACLVGALARRRVIWDLNDLMTPEHFSRLNIRIDVTLAHLCAALIIANSKASADALIEQGGPRSTMRVVYNGIPPEPFDAISDEDAAAVGRELGLTDVPVLGLFGRLSEWKGQHVAIDALATLPGVHLLIVGDALFGEQAYGAKLKAQVARLGLTSRVHFLGFRSDVERLMRFVNVVLHTSTSAEPFGRVIVEGMLARRPVIATRAGGVEEILEHDVTGLMVPPGDAGALARELRGLLADPCRADRIARAGRAHAEARFTVNAMVNAMTEHIEAIARG
jgi:glycosyltransferase involved in cell wall biosynthesis